MGHRKPINSLTIKGFKSIKEMKSLKLSSGINILIGSNGAGKSNFVSYFRMLSEMAQGRLQNWVSRQGGADRILSFGLKETMSIESVVKFNLNQYTFELVPNVDGGMIFEKEEVYFDGPKRGAKNYPMGSGHKESQLNNTKEYWYSAFPFTLDAISKWKVFHFHDTSDTAGVKRELPVHDNEYLRADARNLAAYLYKVRESNFELYEEIRDIVRLAIPFFDDFILKPRMLETGEELINLQWRQHNSDYPLWPSQLSDGSIRFICLATALLQMETPETIIIDEPELGLHPYAITLLGALLNSASKRMQVIVSTQSVPLVNEFSIDDLILVEREDDATVFKRVEEDDFTLWLEDYSPGELWQKNILGGRPPR